MPSAEPPAATTPQGGPPQAPAAAATLAGDHPAGTGSPVRQAAPSTSRMPERLPVDAAAAIPESWRYRLKNKVLGPPLVTEQLSTERLGKPTALAVLSSDVISSSAYATEQALIPLIKAVGVAAFSLLMPVTIAVIVVLAFVTLSYLEVVKVYTKAGGAYVVARENFGLNVAQIAAMSLLIDYTLTVVVSVAAGVAALSSVFSVFAPAPITTGLSVALVILIALANLRGVREAGRVFAVPTYFFITNMVLLIGVGAARAVTGHLGPHPIPHSTAIFTPGTPSSGLFYGAAVFVLLRSFASGGSALTGTEAISNGVSVFRRPEARNVRITMVFMSIILGSLVLGVSSLAAITHPVPYIYGTPTVVYQISTFVYGSSGGGTALVYLLQASTMLILVLAANTSFTGFPFLASFAAADSYMPRQLTKRGHRLVFSTGIIALTVVSCLLLVVTKAQVNNLIPLYAIGVFTGFTMAGAGMFRFHLREREPQWRRRVAINGTASVLSFIVLMVIVVTKFAEGAWTVVIILPVGVFLLIRLHKQYVTEETELEVGAVQACEEPLLRRHVVVVLVDGIDMATARAIQYARTLSPDDLRAVHFDIDNTATLRLEEEWNRLQLARLPLDIVECPDRRLGRAAVELVAGAVADGDTECTVLLPRRGFRTTWSRLLHDRTADRLAEVLSRVPHVSATIVPFNLRGPGAAVERKLQQVIEQASRGAMAPVAAGEPGPAAIPENDKGDKKNDRSDRKRAKAAATARGGTADGETADGKAAEGKAGATAAKAAKRGMAVDRELARRAGDTSAISTVEWRHRVRVAGRVTSVRVQPRGGTSNLECVLSDASGGLLLVFQGRPRIPGIIPGARLVAEGMVGQWGRRLAILNPDYELIGGAESHDPAGH